jgi:hypothetical protein
MDNLALRLESGKLIHHIIAGDETHRNNIGKTAAGTSCFETTKYTIKKIVMIGDIHIVP